MLPPFYYKGVSDEGLFRYFSEVIERVGDERLRIYLYHIPPVSQVPLSLALIERLLKAYPANVVGLKDSSGDWSNTRAVIEQFAGDGFQVYAGSESFCCRPCALAALAVSAPRQTSTRVRLCGSPKPGRQLMRMINRPRWYAPAKSSSVSR